MNLKGKDSLMDERQIIKSAQEGNIEAFTDLVKLYQSSVRACLAVRLENRHEAEDLAQEAFVIAFRKLKDFDSSLPFGPWVRSIALNLLRNHWRKHKPHAVGASADLEGLIETHIDHHYNNSNESESLAALKHCLKKLDEKLQVIVKKHYIHGVPVKEITQELNIKHSAMTMRLHRMREQLRKCINDKVGSCLL